MAATTFGWLQHPCLFHYWVVKVTTIHYGLEYDGWMVVVSVMIVCIRDCEITTPDDPDRE